MNMKKIISLFMAVILMTSCLWITACGKDEAESTELSRLTDASGNTVETMIDISTYTFDTMYGNQIGDFLSHPYTFQAPNGTTVEIPTYESNFYFINSFIELSNMGLNYGFYPVTIEGYLDLSAEYVPLALSGETEAPDYATYGEFFVDYSEELVKTTYIVLSLAQEAGLQLSEETYAAIDEMIARLNETGAVPAGVTLDSYLKLHYGPNCDEAAFRQVLANYYLADLYTSQYIENYEFTEEELMRPTVVHALFEPASESEEDMAAALANAEALMAMCSTWEDVETYGVEQNLMGVALECATYQVEPGVFVPEFEAWALDESREVNDIEIVETSYGYHVMGYCGLQEIDEYAKEDVALSALSEYLNGLAENGGYVLSTAEPYAASAPAPEYTYVTNEQGAIIGSDVVYPNAQNTSKMAVNPMTIVIIILVVIVLGLVIFIVVDKLGKGGKKPKAKASASQDVEENDSPDNDGEA